MSFTKDAAWRLVNNIHNQDSPVPIGHPLRFFSNIEGSYRYFKALTREWNNNKKPVTLAEKLGLV